MASIAEIRAQFPQYNDLSDQQLADSLYTKSYSDMPREEFNVKVGLSKPGSKEYANWALKQALAGNKVPQVSDKPPEYQAPSGPMDQVHAGITSAINAVPIAGPSLMGGARNLKAAVHGRSPESIAAEDEAVQQANPIASTTGTVAGTVLPFMGAGAIPGVGRALGMTGGLGSRVVLGGASGGLIGAADTKARGGSDEEAALSGALGLGLGVALPLAARGFQKAVTPFVAPRATTAAANTLRNEGVELTAGQHTGSKKLKYLESELGGSAADDVMERQGQQFTSAALRRAGINATHATHDVIDNGFSTIGQQFDSLAARNAIAPDRRLMQNLNAAWIDYAGVTGPSQRAPIVNQAITEISNEVATGSISGAFYKTMRSRLDRAARATRDPELQGALRDVMGALDGAMERTLARTNPADLGAWREVRRHYKNMLVIENAVTGAGEQAATGIISPARLRSAAVRQNKRAFARGRNDFVNLADAGVTAMTPLPQSGTAPRLAVRGLTTAVPAVVGATVGGQQQQGWPGAVAGGVAGAAVPWALGLAALSRPGRAVLANQLLAHMPRGLIAPAAPALLANRSR